ncbi:MAG: hypothetical protein KDB37_04680 [Ilumatobacter sp.]|nr:hypothetical protein [Ilumatobacter sp.]
MASTTLHEPDTARLTAASTIQAILPGLVALTLDAKQAHWNVTGPGFVQLHGLTDEFAADVRTWTDRLAERAVALGTPVDARPGTVAAATGRSLPMGWLTDRGAAVELAERIDPVAELIHTSLAELESSDAVAHDAAIETLEGLEKYRWMLLAHTR